MNVRTQQYKERKNPQVTDTRVTICRCLLLSKPGACPVRCFSQTLFCMLKKSLLTSLSVTGLVNGTICLVSNKTQRLSKLKPTPLYWGFILLCSLSPSNISFCQHQLIQSGCGRGRVGPATECCSEVAC